MRCLQASVISTCATNMILSAFIFSNTDVFIKPSSGGKWKCKVVSSQRYRGSSECRQKDSQIS